MLSESPEVAVEIFQLDIKSCTSSQVFPGGKIKELDASKNTMCVCFCVDVKGLYSHTAVFEDVQQSAVPS